MVVIKRALAVGLGFSMLIFAGTAQADIGGTIDATITLESGCIINNVNNPSVSGGVDFGSIDFGTETTLFDEVDGQVTGVGAGISIQCTAGVAPNLIFQDGLYDDDATGAGNKAMRHSLTTTQFVSYNLLLDDGVTVIADGDNIELEDDGSAQIVVVNGRAYGTAGLITGTYNDTVTVLLEI